MATLTTTIEDMMTPQVLGRVASESGLPETKVRTGIAGAVATILDSLAGKTNDNHTMGRVADLVSTAPQTVVDAPERAFEEGSPIRRSGNELVGLATDSGSLTSRLASMLGVGAKAAGS